MADKNKPQDDLSIEEILGSIRRIIAEDDEPEATVIEMEDENEDGVQTLSASHADEEPDEDEEPLELTNKIEPDGTIVDTAETTEYIAPTPVGAEPPEPEQIDFVDQKPEPVEEPTLISQPEPQQKFEEKIILVEEPDTMAMQDDDDMTPSEALLSNSTAEATSAVMAKLARHTALMEEGAGGATIESMVREILKPMLKSWLDENLPNLVQKMVEREIERLTKHL
jgi:cell pole-organizing protein PopZ